MPQFELNRLLSYDDEAILAELRRVAALVDSPFLTKTVFDRHSKVHSSTVRKRFGTWQEALAKAGLEIRSAQTREALKAINRRLTDDEILAAIRLVSEKYGGNPVTQELFNQHAEMNAATVRDRFGSWGAGLNRAGVAISNHGKRYSDEDYFENLLSVWTHHGRQPKYGEMDEPPSAISSNAYEKKWGTWTRALLAFVERVNSDNRQNEAEPIPVAPETVARQVQRRRPGRRRAKEEDQRQIKLGLRYAVLKRDRFRCVLCGASPATNLGCVLHVDHVVPWSKGGETIAENLRSLCEDCNLGKSDKLEGP